MSSLIEGSHFDSPWDGRYYIEVKEIWHDRVRTFATIVPGDGKEPSINLGSYTSCIQCYQSLEFVADHQVKMRPFLNEQGTAFRPCLAKKKKQHIRLATFPGSPHA